MFWTLIRYLILTIAFFSASGAIWLYLTNSTLSGAISTFQNAKDLIVEKIVSEELNKERTLFETVDEDTSSEARHGIEFLIDEKAKAKQRRAIEETGSDVPDSEELKTPSNLKNSALEKAERESLAEALPKNPPETQLKIQHDVAGASPLGGYHLSSSIAVTKQVALHPSAPKIAVVIDDMGMEPNASRRMVALPRPLTMAFLPHGEFAPELSAEAHDNGHEILVHAPMEPQNLRRHDPGPVVLTVSHTELEIRKTLNAMLAKFGAYAGINNHMGSRFTEDQHSMKVVAQIMKERNLLFLDSLTSPHSIASKIMTEAGVSTVQRDLFIDVDRSRAAIDRQLAYAEVHARHHGSVVAIGHPGRQTFEALSDWLPTLREKGFQLVAISELATKSKGVQASLEPDIQSSEPVQLVLGDVAAMTQF